MGPLTNMSELNAALGKILRRPLQKGEIMYQVISQRGMGHVASVQLPCLPGEWAEMVFTGEASMDKRMAEQAAAGAALEALNADPAFAQQINAPKVKKSWPPQGRRHPSFTGGAWGGPQGMSPIMAQYNQAVANMGFPMGFTG